jgi:hypothetical protein
MAPTPSPQTSNVDLNTSSLKMYWNVARRCGGQELWRRLLLVSWLEGGGA